MHSFFITADEELFSAGHNSYGELGAGVVKDDTLVMPCRIERFSGKYLHAIAAGTCVSYIDSRPVRG